ncbi:MAG: lactate racemase domain-containing protein [Planctomycetota bacterium]
MARIELPTAHDPILLDLPEQWNIQQIAEPKLASAQADWPERIASALSQPGNGQGLSRLIQARRGGRFVIVVEDITRHSPLVPILEVIARELEHGKVADSQVEILFATGMHHKMTAKQAREKIGPFADRFNWRSNPWTEPQAYSSIGRAGRIELQLDTRLVQADLRIIISSVSPHLQAGFGGGAQMLLPGCASLESIRHLHRLGLGRNLRQMVGTDAGANLMRATIDRAGQLLEKAGGKTLSIQYVLDSDNQPTSIAVGDLLAVQQMLAKHCAVSCGVVVHEPADIVIAGAFPRDYDLWQSFKCIPNTMWALRPGGVLICVTDCPAGRNGIQPPKWPLSPRWTRNLVGWLGGETLASLIGRLVPRLAGDAAFFVRMGMQTIERNPVIFLSPRLSQEGDFPGVTLCDTMERAAEACHDILGTGPQRVTVFPQGGVTYPIPQRPGRNSAT